MAPTFTVTILFLGLAAFAFTIYVKLSALKGAKPVELFDHPLTRLKKMFEFACLQGRFFKHGVISGFLHAIIFWGFCAVALRTIILFGEGFDPGFGNAFEASAMGHAYSVFKNIFQVLVVISCAALMFRRIALKPKRLTLSLEANVILLAIIVLMLTDLFIEFGFYPEASYYTHLVIIVAFLNFLPYSKHFHIITSLPNVFFQRLGPTGELSEIDLEDETATTFGVNSVLELDQKQVLDLYSCTECGRCQDECPAHITGKPLSPKELSITLRDRFNEETKGSALSGTIPFDGTPAKKEELVENCVKKETIWSCTTCKACEEACPLFIEYVDKIVDLRRHQVLMKGDFPAEAQTALKNTETNYNPWGIGYQQRGDWAKGLTIKTLAEDSNVEYLFFVGCAGSFDERAKKVSVATAKLLKKAGVSFGILGAEEKCTGDSARRLGNEYLFQTLARDNIATFAKYSVKKIITACPHCYNTLKNEYPKFGGKYEVWHHSEFLLKLVTENRMRVTKDEGRRTKDESPILPPPSSIVLHDSCYLGRYNNIYDAPRELLKLAGYTVNEPEKTRDFGMCCGAGGGRMWLEEAPDQRVNHKRLEQLTSTGSGEIATACPFCLTMLSDAAKEMNSDQNLPKDISELIIG